MFAAFLGIKKFSLFIQGKKIELVLYSDIFSHFRESQWFFRVNIFFARENAFQAYIIIETEYVTNKE